MSVAINPKVASGSRWASRMASVVVALLGAGGLVGRALHFTAFISFFPGLATMKANTALGLLLSGVSLWLLGKEASDRSTAYGFCRFGHVCAMVVTLLGLLTVSEYVLGWELGIDQLLFTGLETDAETSFPGRMPPHTAVSFSLVGVSLVLLARGRRKSQPAAQVLAMATAMISGVALVGYVYSVVSFYQIASYAGMGLRTAVSLFLLEQVDP